MNNMSTSPYEIRLDVLKLAKDILDSNIHSQPSHNFGAVSAVNASASISSTNMASANMSSSLEVTKPYTADDVISTANRLYSFIKDNR